MRKIYLYSLVVTVVTATIYMIFQSVFKLNLQSQGNQNTKTLSVLIGQLKDMDKSQPLNSYLKPSLLVYFNSECDYCQRQIKLINDSPEILQQFQLILVSYQDIAEVKNYLTKHLAVAKTGYKFYQVEPDKVLATFGKTSLPQLYIYENNLLKSTYKGFTKAHIILKTASL